MPTSMEVLGTAECIDLLRHLPVGRIQLPLGRIGISIDALPVILPVHYAVIGGAIVFRTNPGTKLAAATDHAVVAFEVDSYDEDSGAGWSVVVQGVASEVRDVDPYGDLLDTPAGAWARGGRADHVVRIELHSVSGRRFAAGQAERQRTPSR